MLKDPRSRFVIVVPPLVQLLIFSYAATFDLNNIPLAIYNEDSGAPARTLVKAFAGSRNFKLVAVLRNSEEMAPLIDNKRVLTLIHIGPKFSDTIYRNRMAPLQVIVDGRNSNTALIALNYVRTIIQTFNFTWMAQHGKQLPPAQLEVRAWFNSNLESQWFIVPGIVGLMSLVVTILVSALSVAREREQGTFDQLLVTPYTPLEILIGKALPGFIIGIVEVSLIIAVAIYWFEVPMRGNFLTLYTGIALFMLSAIGIGLMISSLSVTQQQGLLGAFLFIVPAIVLSGFATPIANMPPIVQDMTLLNPMRYFLIILRGVFLEGASFKLLIPQFWPLAITGVTTLSAAAWLFRRRLY